MAAKGNSICPSIPGSVLFDQPLPGSQEPVLRAVPGVAYPVGYEVHLSPLLTRVHTVLTHLAVQRLPLLFGYLRHRAAELHRHVNSHRKLDHSEPLVPALGAVPQKLLLVPGRVRPHHHLVHPGRQMPQRFGQHSQLLMTRKYVAVPKLGECTINSASDQ